MNKVVLMGRLTKDPEVRYTNSQRAFCRFTVAVNRQKDEADFISCIAWNAVAENMGKYVRKGDRVLIDGSIQTGSYEKNSQKVYTTDINAWSVQFIDMHKKDGGFTPTDEPIPDAFDDLEQEGLPF